MFEDKNSKRFPFWSFRAASAVGEGSMSVQFVNEFLKEM